VISVDPARIVSEIGQRKASLAAWRHRSRSRSRPGPRRRRNEPDAQSDFATGRPLTSGRSIEGSTIFGSSGKGGGGCCATTSGGRLPMSSSRGISPRASLIRPRPPRRAHTRRTRSTTASRGWLNEALFPAALFQDARETDHAGQRTDPAGGRHRQAGRAGGRAATAAALARAAEDRAASIDLPDVKRAAGGEVRLSVGLISSAPGPRPGAASGSMPPRPPSEALRWPISETMRAGSTEITTRFAAGADAGRHGNVACAGEG